jgi:hypothetical protein
MIPKFSTPSARGLKSRSLVATVTSGLRLPTKLGEMKPGDGAKKRPFADMTSLNLTIGKLRDIFEPTAKNLYTLRPAVAVPFTMISPARVIKRRGRRSHGRRHDRIAVPAVDDWFRSL